MFPSVRALESKLSVCRATSTEPRIYVACLASYNAGILHGKWIACDGKSADELAAEVAALLASSPVPRAEESAIHDHEGFEGFDVGEFTALSEIADITSLLDEYGDVARAAATLAVNDLEQVRSLCEDKYLGSWASVEEYAESLLEGQINLPSELACYFDYEAFGRDLELSGDISTIEGADGMLHVFDNH